MVEQSRIAKTRGPYRLRARADAVARTRKRITDAAVELHGTVGPASTTMSAVAARAGVTRATLYRHFADEGALFAACSREWLSVHPRPDTARWAAISDPVRRTRVALLEMYEYYRSAEGMLANLLRDIDALPESIARSLQSYPDAMLDVLDAGWEPAGERRLRRAAIVHAVAFDTWRALAREGLSDGDAANLMARLVVIAGEEPRTERPT